MSFQYNPKCAVRVLKKRDKRLAKLIDKVGPFAMELERMQSPYKSLLRAIVYQQLSGHAAKKIYDRVRALVPRNRAPGPRQLLEISDQALRDAGMSWAKIAAAKDLAERCAKREIPSLRALHEMSDETIIERLIEVRGIGQWTVEMMLMSQLGRPDVLPVTDLGIRKGYMIGFGTEDLPAPKFLLEYGERWRPYRSVASWYLWEATRLS